MITYDYLLTVGEEVLADHASIVKLPHAFWVRFKLFGHQVGTVEKFSSCWYV